MAAQPRCQMAADPRRHRGTDPPPAPHPGERGPIGEAGWAPRLRHMLAAAAREPAAGRLVPGPGRSVLAGARRRGLALGHRRRGAGLRRWWRRLPLADTGWSWHRRILPRGAGPPREIGA